MIYKRIKTSVLGVAILTFAFVFLAQTSLPSALADEHEVIGAQVQQCNGCNGEVSKNCSNLHFSCSGTIKLCDYSSPQPGSASCPPSGIKCGGGGICDGFADVNPCPN